LLDLLVDAGLCQSRGQARKDVQGGGIYLNNEREGDFQRQVTVQSLLFGRHVLLRKGKRNYVMVTLRPS
jgi:tyrosyl-tRNA synthetase